MGIVLAMMLKTLCLGAGEAPAEFQGIQTARIEAANGMPRLLLNDQPTPPLIFFFNSAMETGGHHLVPQVRQAAEAGIHLLSMPFVGWPWEEEGDYGYSDGILDRFIEVDPEALFILRLYAEPSATWPGWAQVPDGQNMAYADGSAGPPSIASDLYWDAFKENVARMIRRYEASPYGPRIVGYQPCAQNTGEWFPHDYRTKGPDISEANQQGFRAWLREVYASDAALSEAWGRPCGLESARIPEAEPGRFPMHMAPEEEPIEAFYACPEERDWVDYSTYQSDCIADRILEAAALIKQETGRKKLAVFFYGYAFELPGSMGGHGAMGRVLRSPDVDALAGPISYAPIAERLTGGASAAMTALDSVALHGKLWINEDDMRTHLIDPKKDLPVWLSEEAFGKQTAHLDETRRLLARNLGAVIVHRAGTWWMDLIAAGAFEDARLWRLMESVGRPAFTELMADPQPYRPEAALILNERSRFFEKSDWDLFCHSRPILRNACAKTGAAVGYYYLDDFIEGLVPPCKAYLFANAFCLDEAQTAGIRARLEREGATAIWLYAPGYLNPAGEMVGACERLTGIRARTEPGPLGSRGAGPCEGLSWGWDRPNQTNPRMVIEDPEAEVLGRYRADDAPSTARKRTGNHTSVICGDASLSVELLRRLFKEAGVHLWADGDAVVHTDGRALIVHASYDRVITVTLPEGLSATPVALPGDDERENSFAGLQVRDGETRWFSLAPATSAAGQTTAP